MLEKAIWLVPQAFGGNEWWTREPTAAEMRGATYMGLINGSRGFQYFIRHGQNGFPKSTTAWAEAGAMALEIAELSPYVLSGEDAPEVSIADSLARSPRMDTRREHRHSGGKPGKQTKGHFRQDRRLGLFRPCIRSV